MISIPPRIVGDIQSLVDKVGALKTVGRLDLGLMGNEVISYDRLDDVPRIEGPLIDLDVEPKGPLLTKDEIMGDELYRGLQGSSYERQRSFLQDLAGRHQQTLEALENYPLEFKKGLLIEGEDLNWIKLGAVYFMQALGLHDYDRQFGRLFDELYGLRIQMERSHEFESKYRTLSHKALGQAISNFNSVKLYEAAGIVDTVRERWMTEAKESWRKYYPPEFIARDDNYYFLSGFTTGAGRFELGAAYLYELRKAKLNEDWWPMQQLFLHAARKHEQEQAYHMAARAYLASAWAFAQEESVPINNIEFAVSALRSAERVAKTTEQGMFEDVINGAASILATQLTDLQKMYQE